MGKFARPELVVGVFGIIAFAIIIFMSREVSDTPFVKNRGRHYRAHFGSVSGLIPKTPIEVAGIQVGFVKDISLDNGKALVELAISDEIPIYDDAVVTIKSRGVLGDKFVQINPGTTGRRVLEENEFIMGARGEGDLGALMDTMSDAAEHIRELAKNLNTFVNSNTSTMEDILHNVDEFTGQMAKMSVEGGDFRELVANLKEVSHSLRRFADEQLNTSLAQSAQSLESTMKSLDAIAEKVERGEGTVGRLINDEETVERMNSALEGVEDFTRSLGRIQTEIRYRGEYLTSSNELQNMVALTIRPRPDKFFRFEVVDSPDGDTRVIDTVVESPPGTPVSNTRTVQRSDNIVFSFELAKRFYDATIRFGLIRNEGGVGFDYHLFDDILTLSFEAFDFSRINNNFHFRGVASLNLWRHLILTGGVDDILNDTGDVNAFMGAGITFGDDDIKSLFGVLSASAGRI